MLQRKGNQYELYPFKVSYLNYEESTEQWAIPDKEWWATFAEKWSHVSDLQFEEIPVTEDMQKRFEEIKDMPEDFSDIYTEYVLTGDTPGDLPMQQGHPFRVLLLTNENIKLNKNINSLEGRQNTTEPLVERVKTATEIYEENKDDEAMPIEALKLLRIGKLKEECQSAIEDGFEFNGMKFGFNTAHDQANFTQQLLLVVAGQVEPIQWKTKNAGVIELAVEQFKAVANAGKEHKMSEQAKYWEKEQAINECTTKEQIKQILWNDEIA